jgi:hypothetical protein
MTQEPRSGEQRVDSAVTGTRNATTPRFTLAIAFDTRTEPTITADASLGSASGFLERTPRACVLAL